MRGKKNSGCNISSKGGNKEGDGEVIRGCAMNEGQGKASNNIKDSVEFLFVAKSPGNKKRQALKCKEKAGAQTNNKVICLRTKQGRQNKSPRGIEGNSTKRKPQL